MKGKGRKCRKVCQSKVGRGKREKLKERVIIKDMNDENRNKITTNKKGSLPEE